MKLQEETQDTKGPGEEDWEIGGEEENLKNSAKTPALYVTILVPSTHVILNNSVAFVLKGSIEILNNALNFIDLYSYCRK